MADFDELLKTMHEHGLKLIMDLVVNHCSSEVSKRHYRLSRKLTYMHLSTNGSSNPNHRSKTRRGTGSSGARERRMKMEKRFLPTTGSLSLALVRRGPTTKARTSGISVSLSAKYVNLVVSMLFLAYLPVLATRSQLGKPGSSTSRLRSHEILARQGRRWVPDGRHQLDFQGAGIA